MPRPPPVTGAVRVGAAPFRERADIGVFHDAREMGVALCLDVEGVAFSL